VVRAGNAGVPFDFRSGQAFGAKNAPQDDTVILDIAKSCFTILSMRSTRILSITLPPAMLKRAQSIAKRESRTMSELIREALRHYDRRAWWDEVNAYGRQRAEERGLREGDVERLVHESRRGSKKAVKK
jgi:CopG family transcriptional regulator / antitoxin EndoAI